MLKRDRSFRPIIIFNVKRLKELGKDMEFVVRINIFVKINLLVRSWMLFP